MCVVVSLGKAFGPFPSAEAALAWLAGSNLAGDQQLSVVPLVCPSVNPLPI
jgi:hypothetical protein